MVLPVMAATGGSGRTTVAALLAGEFAAFARTVVLDTAPRLTSPWPEYGSAPESSGLAALAPDRPLTRSAVLAASVHRHSPGGRWQVLTDTREWHAPPLFLPEPPAAWYQLAAIGGWQAVIADTVHPVAHDVLAARYEQRQGQTRGWCELLYSVPLLCAAATATGVQALQQATMALHAEGLPLQRMVVVLVGLSDGRPAPAVRAAGAMLASRAAAVVHLPFDTQIRAHGLREPLRTQSTTRQAADRIAKAVLDTAHGTWGTPLPAAPVPAALSHPVARYLTRH
ncbi:hypothetical protein ABZ135_31340 [Streptomyces sp. NPDC006339]|uniref:hypothetical protein n=1 Tax=Streptomyces sp. NPDC006339 TaxID=3156755 RepID=UPI0033A5FABC